MDWSGVDDDDVFMSCLDANISDGTVENSVLLK